MKSRRALLSDAPSIVRIYNEGIADRIATFETEPRDEATVRAWFDRPHPIVVVEDEGVVIAWAAAQPSSPRACYARNCEFSVYVARRQRGRGAGRIAMEALIASLSNWNKLISHVFADNTPSLKMLRAVGFREVGTLARHGAIDGAWRDVVVVERLL